MSFKKISPIPYSLYFYHFIIEKHVKFFVLKIRYFYRNFRGRYFPILFNAPRYLMANKKYRSIENKVSLTSLILTGTIACRSRYRNDPATVTVNLRKQRLIEKTTVQQFLNNVYMYKKARIINFILLGL